MVWSPSCVGPSGPRDLIGVPDRAVKVSNEQAPSSGSAVPPVDILRCRADLGGPLRCCLGQAPPVPGLLRHKDIPLGVLDLEHLEELGLGSSGVPLGAGERG